MRDIDHLPNRREALAGLAAISTLTLTWSLRAQETSLEITPEILEALKKARESMVVLGLLRGEDIMGFCSGFFVKKDDEKYLITAGHCADERLDHAILDPLFVDQMLEKPIVSKEADVALFEVERDVEGLEMLDREVVEGEDVLKIEPAGLRFGNPVMRDGKPDFLGMEGYPPIHTKIDGVRGNRIKTEHYTIPGSSGSPLLIMEEQRLKVAGVYSALTWEPRIENGKMVNDVDGIYTKIDEVRKLIESLHELP